MGSGAGWAIRSTAHLEQAALNVEFFGILFQFLPHVCCPFMTICNHCDSTHVKFVPVWANGVEVFLFVLAFRIGIQFISHGKDTVGEALKDRITLARCPHRLHQVCYVHSKHQYNISSVQMNSHPTLNKTIGDCRLMWYLGNPGWGVIRTRHCKQVPAADT